MTYRSFFSRWEWVGVGTVLFGFLFLLPALNAWVPKSSVWHISEFSLSLWGKYATYTVMALGLGLLWGQAGILSLGQALFFALGGYAMGMYLILRIGTRGQYHSLLPDYMVFLGYKALPWHFKPFYNFWFALAASVWVPALVAWIFGSLAFRSRIRGVYFSILTQALTYAACLLFFRNELTFGGNNGFTDFKDILGFDLNDAGTKRVLYGCSWMLVGLAYILCRWIECSRLGIILRAIRDNEERLLFLGYATHRYKVAVFVLAAGLSGIAGALYVPLVGIINPSEMEPVKSLEAVVWVALGGRMTAAGAIVGAVLVNVAKSYATRFLAEYWLFVLGGVFIMVTLVMPEGVVGIVRRAGDVLRGKKGKAISRRWLRVGEGVGMIGR